MLTVENNETLQNALDALQYWSEQQLINLNIKIAKSYPLEDLLIKLIKYTIDDCNTHTISIETGIRLLYLGVCFDDKLFFKEYMPAKINKACMMLGIIYTILNM